MLFLSIINDWLFFIGIKFSYKSFLNSSTINSWKLTNLQLNPQQKKSTTTRKKKRLILNPKRSGRTSRSIRMLSQPSKKMTKWRLPEYKLKHLKLLWILTVKNSTYLSEQPTGLVKLCHSWSLFWTLSNLECRSPKIKPCNYVLIKQRQSREKWGFQTSRNYYCADKYFAGSTS